MNKSTSERVLKCTRERSEVSPPLLGAPQFRSCWGREPRFANIWQRAQQRSKEAQTIQRVSLIRISLKWLSSHTSPFIKTLCRLSYITSQSTNGYGLRQLLQVDGFLTEWTNQLHSPRVAPISPIWWLINNQLDLILSVFYCRLTCKALYKYDWHKTWNAPYPDDAPKI